MAHCRHCEKKSKQLFFETKLVCIQCDELLFDLEIELDEASEASLTRKTSNTPDKGLGTRNTKTA